MEGVTLRLEVALPLAQSDSAGVRVPVALLLGYSIRLLVPLALAVLLPVPMPLPLLILQTLPVLLGDAPAVRTWASLCARACRTATRWAY